MIIDQLQNADRYFSLHPRFEAAFKYLKGLDLATIEEGKYDIAEGLKANVVEKQGMTATESISKFECHNNNIDIQLCIRGLEQIGWKSRLLCHDQKGEYNAEKDVLFYNDAPDMYFQLTDNQFAIFFPEDVHAPMISDGKVRKLIVKVKM